MVDARARTAVSLRSMQRVVGVPANTAQAGRPEFTSSFCPVRLAPARLPSNLVIEREVNRNSGCLGQEHANVVLKIVALREAPQLIEEAVEQLLSG